MLLEFSVRSLMVLLPLLTLAACDRQSDRPEQAQGASEAPASGDAKAPGMGKVDVSKRGTPAPAMPFTGPDGAPATLSAFRGKPLLVNFVFTGCFQVCPTSTRDLQGAVRAMRDRFGPDQFNVISIGFNQPTDSPLAMKMFAAQLRIKEPNWEFLSPRAEDVPRLTGAFGFRFRPSPSGFDHTVQVSLLDAQGVIRTQVYGDFSAEALGEPIRRLLRGMLISDTHTAADFIDRVRIFCSVYDPTTGKYKADYTLILQIAGGVTFFVAMLGFGVGEWWSQRKARRRLREQTA